MRRRSEKIKKFKDIYKLANGKLMAFGQGVYIPQGAKLWNGYNYKNQCWIYHGKKDTRTLEEIGRKIIKTDMSDFKDGLSKQV